MKMINVLNTLQLLPLILKKLNHSQKEFQILYHLQINIIGREIIHQK